MWKEDLHLRRWTLRLLLVFGLCFVARFLAVYPSYQMRQEDDVEAVKLIVAWIAEHKPLPGYREEYPDWEIVGSRRVIVICDFLPPGLAISQNSRIERVTEAEYQAHGRDIYRGRDFLRIKQKESSDKKRIFEVSNIFGSLGGHGYDIAFQKKLSGLRADVKFLWIM